MNIITVMEISLAALAFLFFVTQIALPAFRGTTLFPMLRREGDLERKLAEAKQTTRERDLQKTVSEQQSKGRK